MSPTSCQTAPPRIGDRDGTQVGSALQARISTNSRSGHAPAFVGAVAQALFAARCLQ